jgi:GNAT superfamily N-acetyltransferase
MHVRLSDEVYRAKEAYSAEDTTANRALLLEAETRFQAISLALQGASAEAGRALNIHRKLKQALADHIPMRLVERALSVEKTPAREKTAKSPQGRPAKLADKDFGAENRLVTATETRSKLQLLKDALKSRPLFQGEEDTAAWKLTLGQFRGNPRLYTPGREQLKEGAKRVYASTQAAAAEPFLDGLTIRKGASQYAVFDGEKVVATYTGGDNLVVDPAYRRRGVASELLRLYKSEVDPSPSSASRTKDVHKLYAQVHRKIVAAAVAEGKPVPAAVLADYPDLKPGKPLFQAPAEAPADEASRKRPDGSPVPPELWDDLVVAGLGLREGGYRRKDGWKRIMRSELGELSDQALDEIWTATKGEAKKRAVKQLTQKDLATKKLKAQLERAGLSEDEIKALVEDFDANVPENDPVAMIEYLRKRGKMTAGAMLNSYWKANVLSGVRTQARNLLDNALNGALATLERPVVAGVDAVRSKLTGEPRTYYAGETLPAMVGGLVGSVDGVKQGLQVLRRGYSDRALENMDYPQELPGGGKNPWNWVGRSLEASDQFSGAMAERSEIHAGAVRTAMQEKLAGEAFKARVKELIASPTPEMRESAEAFRKHATYRNDPDAFVKLILKIRGATAFGPQHNLPILPSMGKFKGVQLPLEGFSLADPILPFVLTPWNVLKTSLEFTPGVGLAKLTDSEFRKSSEASKLIARQLMGAAVVKMLWGVAAAGLMTSGWPEDEKERDEWKRLGIQPYSFKVGGTWYSYQQSGPLKLALTTMAEFHNWTKKGKERDLGEKLAQAVSSIGHSMVDSSFLSGLNGFVSALTTPERSAERFAAGIAGGFVPFSGLTRNVADAVDRRERDPKGFGERLASGIPGLSGKVPGKIDGFGAVQQKAGGRASAFLASAPSKESTDAVQQQLRRLGVRPITPGDEIAAGKLTRSQHAELLQRSGQAQLAAARDYLTGPGATAGITSEHQAERVRTKMKEAADAARKDYLRELNDRKAEAAAKLARGKPTR